MHDADGGANPQDGGTGGTEPNDDTTQTGADNPGDTKDDSLDDKSIPYDRFKEVNDKRKELEARLAEIERQKEEDEAAKLIEQNKYKELYEQAQAKIESERADALKTRKEVALIKAGYSDEQSERLLRYVDGEDSEGISASIETLKEDIPPKQSQSKGYVDPSINNGTGGKPASPDGADLGRSLLEKALGKK